METVNVMIVSAFHVVFVVFALVFVLCVVVVPAPRSPPTLGVVYVFVFVFRVVVLPAPRSPPTVRVVILCRLRRYVYHCLLRLRHLISVLPSGHLLLPRLSPLAIFPGSSFRLTLLHTLFRLRLRSFRFRHPYIRLPQSRSTLFVTAFLIIGITEEDALFSLYGFMCRLCHPTIQSPIHPSILHPHPSLSSSPRRDRHFYYSALATVVSVSP